MEFVNHNRPGIGATLAAFLYALADWGLSSVPPTVPEPVITSGSALAMLLVGLLVGYVVQYVGKNATWSAESHQRAVAYALMLDADEHRDELGILVRELGVESVEEARRLVGLDE